VVDAGVGEVNRRREIATFGGGFLSVVLALVVVVMVAMLLGIHFPEIVPAITLVVVGSTSTRAERRKLSVWRLRPCGDDGLGERRERRERPRDHR
jgi:hypothetical protein